MNTTTDNGNDPLEKVSEQETEFQKHAQNVEHLRLNAEDLDEFADSMRVSYDDDTELGTITLYFEYYDHDRNKLDRMDELSSESEATSEDVDEIADAVNEGMREETFEEFLEMAIDLVKGGEFEEAKKYINGCLKLVDDDELRTFLNLVHYDCRNKNEERILKHLYDARYWDDKE